MIFGGLLIVNLVLQFVQSHIFAYLVNQIESKMRTKLVKSIVYKQVSWFDWPDNSPAELSRIVVGDVHKLSKDTVYRRYSFLEALCICAWGVAIAVVFASWQQAVFMACLSPFIVYSTKDVQQHLMSIRSRPK